MTDVLRLPLAAVMLLYQSIALALSQIWANKVRGILTTLGILIGVAAVSAVIALITGMRQRVLNEFEAFGANKIFIESRFPRSARSSVSWRQVIFRLNDFDELLEHCPSVSKYTPVAYNGGTLTYRTKTEDQNVSVMGVGPDWHDIEHRWVTSGRPMSVLDNAARRPVCLINQVVRDKLEMKRDPTGEYIQVGENRMLVIGLLEAPPASIGNSSEQREVIIPFNTMSADQRWMWYSVLATAKTPEVSEDAKAEIEFYLRQKRGVKPGKEDTFQVMTAQRVIEQFSRVASIVTMIATGIVGISLLVGGVGIMNIMLVSVSERTREIGLRKAVGARPGVILMQFLVEAIALCLLGGALGLGFGQVLTSIVASFLPSGHPTGPGGPESGFENIVIPANAIILAFTFSGGVGLIFGMFPAIKAARLDPIEALRHE